MKNGWNKNASLQYHHALGSLLFRRFLHTSSHIITDVSSAAMPGKIFSRRLSSLLSSPIMLRVSIITCNGAARNVRFSKRCVRRRPQMVKPCRSAQHEATFVGAVRITITTSLKKPVLKRRRHKKSKRRDRGLCAHVQKGMLYAITVIIIIFARHHHHHHYHYHEGHTHGWPTAKAFSCSRHS